MSSSRTIAVISSGDQEGPQPPEKHALAAGTSNTWMWMTSDMAFLFYEMRTAPMGHARMHTPQPVHFSGSILYPPGTALTACCGQTRLTGQNGLASQFLRSIEHLVMKRLPIVSM